MTKPLLKGVLERVDKLLRLAAPSSNTTEAERASAALEAARLISEHGLVVREKQAPLRRAPASATPWKPRAPESPRTPDGDQRKYSWTHGVASHDAYCSDPECREPIDRGAAVWMRIHNFSVQYLHYPWPCTDDS